MRERINPHLVSNHMIDEIDVTEAYRAGKLARRKGFKRDTNPYRYGTVDCGAWFEGWDEVDGSDCDE